MVRFLHTSDWQMGMRAVHAGSKSKDIRIKRYETGLNVVNLAKKKSVDFVIIAGDIFEHNDIDEVVVKKTVDILNQFAPIPVFIIPGNHDPFLPGAIWDRSSWQRIGPHITLFTEEGEYVLPEGVVLYPCPVKQKRSSIDPTTWIPKRENGDNRIRIGIAHGSLDSLPGQVNFPISKISPEEKGLDYLALGDWHSFSQFNRAVYPGSFEPTSYSEPDSGNILIVEIPTCGMSPEIEKIRCRTLNWVEYPAEIKNLTDIEKFEEFIKSLGRLSSLVLRARIRLYLSGDENLIQQLDTLHAELDEGAFYLEWNQEDELPIGEEISMRLPEGVLSEIDEALQNILCGKIPLPPCHIFAGQDPVVVQKARSLLYTFERRKGS